jgi:hypothetical protein
MLTAAAVVALLIVSAAIVVWALNERCPDCGRAHGTRTGESTERRRWPTTCGHLWLEDMASPAHCDVALCEDECACGKCGATYSRLRLRLD